MPERSFERSFRMALASIWRMRSLVTCEMSKHLQFQEAMPLGCYTLVVSGISRLSKSSGHQAQVTSTQQRPCAIGCNRLYHVNCVVMLLRKNLVMTHSREEGFLSIPQKDRERGDSH